MRRIPNPVLEDVVIKWPNFSGEPDKFNRAGDRHFTVFLDTDIAEQMEQDGWNIKWLEPLEEGDNPQAHLNVAVNYNNIPPRIFMITGQGKTLLTEETVGLLDYAAIQTADLIINPYAWEVNGKSGIKAYVKSLYITVEEDEFAHKYYDTPDLDSDIQSDPLPEAFINIDDAHEI